MKDLFRGVLLSLQGSMQGTITFWAYKGRNVKNLHICKCIPFQGTLFFFVVANIPCSLFVEVLVPFAICFSMLSI